MTGRNIFGDHTRVRDFCLQPWKEPHSPLSPDKGLSVAAGPVFIDCRTTDPDTSRFVLPFVDILPHMRRNSKVAARNSLQTVEIPDPPCSLEPLLRSRASAEGSRPD